MPDLTHAALLRAMGDPQGAEVLLAAALGSPPRASYRPAEIGALAVALLEMTELAAESLGMDAFESAVEDALEASLDDILADLPENLN